MGKSLYSLMLNEDVVREVDLLAHRLGTNRSNLINQILAEYVNYTTPEKRISDVFTAIERLMSPSLELVPVLVKNSSSMSLKSSLEYKYRPTIKYDVELFRSGDDTIGEISVMFRTQSPALIQIMTSFFLLWKKIEDTHLTAVTGASHAYSVADGKFCRSIALPDHSCTSEQLAETLSEYIKLFDRLLKGYLAGRYDAHEIEAAYYSHMMNSPVHI